MQSIDLEPFRTWLVQRSIAGEAHAPHYVRWVRRFLQAPGGGDGLATQDRLRVFEDALARDARLEDWVTPTSKPR
jgi:hypothetical protein